MIAEMSWQPRISRTGTASFRIGRQNMAFQTGADEMIEFPHLAALRLAGQRRLVSLRRYPRMVHRYNGRAARRPIPTFSGSRKDL